MRTIAAAVSSSALLVVAGGASVGTRSGAAAPVETRPNILLAIGDDWGWPHAGAYGDPVVRTPTFDRLAREGVLFDHAFVASPSCTPSRAAILTGQWHWRLEESASLWSTLRWDYPVYPELLARAGYHVGLQGKGWGPGRLEPGGRSENPAGREYETFEAFLAARPPGRPFCYWFGSRDPHRDYEEGKGAASGIDLGAIRLFPHFPDAREVRSDVADYYWEVQRFDADVGRMLALLEKRGELERTLVVMTGDNGIPFPRCKANLYDCGVRVPLAVRWPGRLAAGRRLEAFVSLTDLAPTFLELAGVEAPPATTGRSLASLLGKDDPPAAEVAGRDHVICGKERHVPGQEKPDLGGTPMRSLRTRDFLYIRNFRPDRWPAGTPDAGKAVIEGRWLADCDNGPTKQLIVDHRHDDTSHRRLYDLAFAKRPAEELYDLRNDPGQMTNVAGESGFAGVKDRLAARLLRELEATGDPRVLGGAERLEAYPYYGGSPTMPVAPPSPK
ncbi:MAG TPA: sulfatase [Vicinamibacteria bacterium]|nr:sulfatase [Vicinamibacteria bacterium]